LFIEVTSYDKVAIRSNSVQFSVKKYLSEGSKIEIAFGVIGGVVGLGLIVIIVYKYMKRTQVNKDGYEVLK